MRRRSPVGSCARALGEGGEGGAAGAGGERVGEVVVERAALEASGLVDREQPFGGAFAAFGLAAEGELAVDDGGAESAFGVVVGGFDAGDGGEGPESGPELE